MIFGFGVLTDALLLVFGVVWCRAMFGRWRSDLEALRKAKDIGDCVVITALWGVTCVAACIVISTSIGIVRGIAAAF